MDNELGGLAVAAVLILIRIVDVVQQYSFILRKIVLASAAFENLIFCPGNEIF